MNQNRKSRYEILNITWSKTKFGSKFSGFSNKFYSPKYIIKRPVNTPLSKYTYDTGYHFWRSQKLMGRTYVIFAGFSTSFVIASIFTKMMFCERLRYFLFVFYPDYMHTFEIFRNKIFAKADFYSKNMEIDENGITTLAEFKNAIHKFWNIYWRKEEKLIQKYQYTKELREEGKEYDQTVSSVDDYLESLDKQIVVKNNEVNY